MRNYFFYISLSIAWAIVTLGGIGFLVAPGTCASIVTYFLCSYMKYISFRILLTAFVIGCSSIYVWQQFYPDRHDPSFIVIDELCGYVLGYFILQCFGLTHYDLYFLILFRYFDIRKPCGIMKINAYNNVTGIMLDDCLAALFAIAVIKLFIVICFF
jgi:phosphatidylglycerophosphatase A